MKYSYIVTAALLGVLLPVNHIFFLIVTQGYAHIVESNVFVLAPEIVGVAVLTCFTVAKLVAEVKAEVRKGKVTVV